MQPTVWTWVHFCPVCFCFLALYGDCTASAIGSHTISALTLRFLGSKVFIDLHCHSRFCPDGLDSPVNSVSLSYCVSGQSGLILCFVQVCVSQKHCQPITVASSIVSNIFQTERC